MINTLKLVRGAVADKDLVPVLTHFHIYAGRIQGGNGNLAIDAEAPDLADIDATVPADRFIKAIDACDGEPTIKVQGDALMVSKGRFRARLPLADHSTFPFSVLGGKRKKMPGDILPLLRSLRPFAGTDASRAWAVGIQFRAGYAWATNNVVIARTDYPWKVEIGLPSEAVDELLRIGVEPTHYRIEQGAISFEYAGGYWLRSLSLANDPPDFTRFNPDLDQEADWYTQTDVFLDAVQRVAPFCDTSNIPQIICGEDGLSTGEGAFSASMAVPVPGGARFHLDPLVTVLAQAKKIDCTKYPGPMPWRGGGIAGLLMGIR